jgi:hypothetical protein
MNFKHGYLIPENVQPEGFRCLSVVIPDDDEYERAFDGAFHAMTKWLAWDKESGKRARLAADVWKLAYEETMRCYWRKGVIVPCLGELESQLLIDYLNNLSSCNEDENMCNSCGCCSGNNGGGSAVPPPLTEPPPPPLTEPPPTSASWRCDSANQAVDNWAEFWHRTVVNLGAGFTAIDALGGALAAASIITGGTVWILAIAATLAAVIAIPVCAAVRDWYEHHHDNLVCILVNATSPSAAKAAYDGYVSSYGDYPPGGVVGAVVKQLLNYTGGMSDWNKLFVENSFLIDAANVGSDCEACIATLPPPPNPINEPPPEEEVLSNFFFSSVIIEQSLTGGIYEVKNNNPIYYNVWYGARLKHQQGSTWSGWRTQVGHHVNEGVSESEIDFLLMNITDLPGHSGNSDGVSGVLRLRDRLGVEYWGDIELPQEVLGAGAWFIYDSDGASDVWWWYSGENIGI